MMLDTNFYDAFMISFCFYDIIQFSNNTQSCIYKISNENIEMVILDHFGSSSVNFYEEFLSRGQHEGLRFIKWKVTTPPVYRTNESLASGRTNE